MTEQNPLPLIQLTLHEQTSEEEQRKTQKPSPTQLIAGWHLRSNINRVIWFNAKDISDVWENTDNSETCYIVMNGEDRMYEVSHTRTEVIHMVHYAMETWCLLEGKDYSQNSNFDLVLSGGHKLEEL